MVGEVAVLQAVVLARASVVKGEEGKKGLIGVCNGEILCSIWTTRDKGNGGPRKASTIPGEEHRPLNTIPSEEHRPFYTRQRDCHKQKGRAIHWRRALPEV